MTLAKNGDIKVLVIKRQNAFENEVKSNAMKSRTSDNTPKMHLSKRSN